MNMVMIQESDLARNMVDPIPLTRGNIVIAKTQISTFVHY